MTTKLEAALELAAAGFRVFPLEINGKEPICTWQGVATCNAKRIAALWTCPVFDTPMDYNIGVALERDMLVVDVDVRGEKRGRQSLDFLEAVNDPLPLTYTVVTASGGEHRYFRTADRDSGTFPKELAQHIDLKGGTGYVVGRGSTIDGGNYEARGKGGDSEIALAPRWLRDLPVIERDDKGDRMGAGQLAAVELDKSDALKRATEWLQSSAPEAIEGDGGNATTYGVAAKVKDFGVGERKCVDLMLDHWNETKAAPSWDPAELAAVVENAYRYGRSAPGIASPEAEFDAVEIPTSPPRAPNKRGLYVVRWDDAKPILDRPYLIDDLLDLGTLAVIYGDSNAGKTYVVLDQARAVAKGDDWNGHKTHQGLVVYIASEGGSGFHKRIEAYRREHKLSGLPFSLVPCPIDLHSSGDAGDTDRLIRLIRAEEAHFGLPCVLIVVDTLARAMGAGDENTSVDMGLLVRHCDRLRLATGATVNLIHHTGKDKAKGARGSSALRAATDTEIEVDNGVVSVQKQRDMAKGAAMHFALKTVVIGQRGDGKEVTACVVEWVKAGEFGTKVSPEAQQMLDVLRRLIAEQQDAAEAAGNEAAVVRVAWPEWQAAIRETMTGPRGKAISRQRIFVLRPELVNAGLVERDGHDRWSIPDKAD